MLVNELKLKTVAVLGGSYGGNRAAQVLAAGLPNGWRVVLVDRNSHFNHVYNLPRYTVLPGHEHKAFIPYDNSFSNPSSGAHARVHGTITSLHPHHITYIPHLKSAPAPAPVEKSEEETLYFDYAVYALGSHLPSPIDLWGSPDTDLSLETPEKVCLDLESSSQFANRIHQYMGTKQEAISWLRSRQRRIEAAQRVLIVGGGALGIEFASDIAAVYSRKSVTLLHSRSRLLPKFDEALAYELYQGLQELGVDVIFGERLDMPSLNAARTKGYGTRETMLMKTTKGREIEADLVLLCTGQVPNTSLLRNMDPRTVDPKSAMVRVSRTMQVVAPEEPASIFDTLAGFTPSPPMFPSASTNENFVESEVDATCEPRIYSNIFAVGDAADAFGAYKAGHTAYYQAEVAARNVIKLIKGAEKVKIGSPGLEGDLEGDLELEEYVPGPPMIKVSLGLTKSAYEVAGVVGTKDDETDDHDAVVVWGKLGYGNIDEEGMWM